MASSITFGQVEARIRRDILNDNEGDQYRWSVPQVMAAINVAIVDIVERYNSWAGYDFETGKRIANVHTDYVEQNCQIEPSSQKRVMDSNGYEMMVGTLRDTPIPIDGRYYDSISLLAAGRLLLLDETDTENAQKAASCIEMGKEYALR